MIELNEKTQQDFLNREWVNKLLDAGVDMSDAKYSIVHVKEFNIDVVTYNKPSEIVEDQNPIPTYTVSELLYKLHEWISLEINNKEYSGGLTLIKDAPFYLFYYNLRTGNYDRSKSSKDQPDEWNESLFACSEYPIESLASLLIQCHKREIGSVKDISDK